MVIGRRLVSLFCHLLELCCSRVLPFDGVGSGNTFGGGGVFRGNVSSPASYVILLFPSFLFSGFPFLFLVVFALSGYLLIVIFRDVENGFADCNFLRCRERFC